MPEPEAIPQLGRLLDRVNVQVPSLMLVPAFGLVAWFQINYPMRFTGEWVELMVGFGFLFAGLLEPGNRSGKIDSALRSFLPVLATWSFVLVSGGLASLVRDYEGADEQVLATAQHELKALQSDFRSGPVKIVAKRQYQPVR